MSISDLNIARGTRIRVLEDGGKRGLVGLEGIVVQSLPGSVIVVLENDPMYFHRLRMQSPSYRGYSDTVAPPQRHFRVTEVERVDV